MPASPEASSDASRRRIVDLVFFGGLGLVTALILTELIDDILPGGIARRISINSEGYVVALGIGAWLRFPVRGPRRVPVLAALVAAFAIVGYALVITDLPSRFRTLNEACFAIAAGLAYVALPRPIRPWILLAPLGLAVAVVGSIALDRQDWAITQAEAIGVAVLLPLALDVVDRGIVAPRSPTSTMLRWGWYVALAGELVITSALGTDRRAGGGFFAGILDYLGRVHESVIAVLALQLYFAVGLGRMGTPGSFDRLRASILRGGSLDPASR